MEEDARLIELEIRITHQEATLQTLNDVIAVQQRSIDQLYKDIETIKRQFNDIASSNLAMPGEESPPPHY
jgi:SlyX protein